MTSDLETSTAAPPAYCRAMRSARISRLNTLAGRLLALSVAAILASVALHAGGACELAAHLGPALLLLALLVGGRYPGEQTLRRFMKPRRVPRRRASITARPPRRLVLARRACLLAEHLATRPPPNTGLVGSR